MVTTSFPFNSKLSAEQSWQLQCLTNEAVSLPAEMYFSPEIYRLEQQHLFGKYGCYSVQVDTWGPFIFINLDMNADSLAVKLGELPKMQRYRLDQWMRVHTQDYWMDANWKLHVENTAESYQEPNVHPAIAKVYQAGSVNWIPPGTPLPKSRNGSAPVPGIAHESRMSKTGLKG
jgi:phenylpropionate dioxygenase-like ring-hydroxylating dioxygenase large terminal subunit